ncbi:COP1-interactive protein 1 [Ricinus communis]|uniref:COP1-interactive protein 1 n=1 Tax=Ricinus communis TaxID=3988 RepID=UPI00201ABFBC|nr:COP1-interactive protein 1 [Ricinus communis]
MESTENRDNVEDIEQMKENKQEIETKVARILKLIKSNGQDKKGKLSEDSMRISELIGLVHDFHKQYQFLYSQYDNLRGEIGKRARGRKEKENSSSTPTSDSEYYSSEDIENGVPINRHNKSSDSIKAELDTEDFEASANLQYMTAFGKSPKAEITRKDQKNKAQERKREFSTLVKVQEVHGSQASAEIKELEGQLTMLRMELESLHSLKNGLEVQIEEKENEAKRLVETNAQLHTRISELELMSEEKGNKISAMTVQMKKVENNLTSRIQVLVTQVKDLQLETDYLRAELAEMEGSKRYKKSTQVKGLKDQFKIMQQELESLRREKTESQLQLDMKIKETNGNLSQIEALKNEIASKNGQEQGMLKEKEGFLAQMDDLKLEVNSLHDQNNELEEMIRSKNKEVDELREEKGGLQDKILELEKKLAEREDELSNKKYEHEDNEAYTQIVALKAQVNSLQQELDSSVAEKRKLEEQNERLKQKSAENLMQVENEILNLTSKIEDQQKTLKEKDDTIKKFSEESKLIKHHSLDSQKQPSNTDSPKYRSMSATDSPKYRSMDSAKLNHNVFERKIDELAEKFQMKMENHIRLLSRRIRVAEQLHAETRESHKKVLEKLEQENKELHEKKAACEAEAKKMKDMLLESGSNMLTGLDIMMKKMDEENGKFLRRISRISNELQVAKNCLTGKKDEVEKLNYNMETEEESEGDRRNAASKLGRKVEDLEQKLKERDEGMSSLGEEKREAIRQLCVLIEYHRHRYDHLKEAVSKMPIRFKKPT